jgi:DNA-binding protein HU-beta
MNYMKKDEIVKRLLNDANLTKSQAEAALDSLTRMITQETKAQGLFVLPNVGRFKKQTRQGRQGINPQTGLPLFLQDKQVVKFQPSKQFSDTIAVK